MSKATNIAIGIVSLMGFAIAATWVQLTYPELDVKYHYSLILDITGGILFGVFGVLRGFLARN
ncbi:hypothetical protein E4H12_05305 [Candidatus Thorarchaeota archaeon]|nr:MAG: hypothetical protein E4H12_05305 [Candidatus Thorarchaeota archaeon]